ncbi:TetR family transcriptional regulator C-terminal domain-containing protein [Pseudochrobactrum sp. sp1633]|nr:TetR family transcriptional regulator C-terminal domain-containing protein [Pseudochrobactrum sp. sp1633]MDM8344376.1 TetR family transcriptional regulator C-terminal domain-containing protein [Pseudochrobactrum sp. sp1633]HWD14492.1 TetR family transcriptional regulator C-terminal domain-containing protein [Pseudochrobactrum sp.]
MQQEQPESLSRIQEMNRKLILEAALDVFSTYGFRGSTIDQIALKSGMSKPNLLYYFRRKEDIYNTVLQQTMEEWLASMQAIDPQGEPLEELGSYIRNKIEMAFRNPAASRLFANEIMHGAPAIGTFLQEDMRALVDEKAAMIGQWMEEGRLAKTDPHHLIFTIWATTQHYSDFETQLRAVLGEKFDAPDCCEKTVQAVSAILLNGIRPR